MPIVFAGLPGVGKTTIARALAKRLSAAYLRVDTLENVLERSGLRRMEGIGPGGYHAAAALAVDNLRIGTTVIVDSVNPWPATRELWRNAAETADAGRFEIEVICSDIDEHRRRVETRPNNLPGFVAPDWTEVSERDYVPWTDAGLRLDSSALTVEEAVQTVMESMPPKYK